MLAAWFRLKYPHIALGALASSAPLLYFEDTRPKFGYYYIVTKVFKVTIIIHSEPISTCRSYFFPHNQSINFNYFVFVVTW